MREIIQKIYNFHELDKNIQEELIEKEKERQKESFCEVFLLEEMEEKAKILLQQYFGEKASFKKVYYSLNYCQGDGAMIEFELKYYNKRVQIKHHGYNYNENAFLLYESELTEKQEKQLKEKIVKMNYELSQYGYILIEANYSDEEIIEILSENEYFKNGEIYKGVI